MLIFSTGGNSSRHYSILSFTHADHSLLKCSFQTISKELPNNLVMKINHIN